MSWASLSREVVRSILVFLPTQEEYGFLRLHLSPHCAVLLANPIKRCCTDELEIREIREFLRMTKDLERVKYIMHRCWFYDHVDLSLILDSEPQKRQYLLRMEPFPWIASLLLDWWLRAMTWFMQAVVAFLCIKRGSIGDSEDDASLTRVKTDPWIVPLLVGCGVRTAKRLIQPIVDLLFG